MYEGEEALSKRGILALRYPIDNGIVTNGEGVYTENIEHGTRNTHHMTQSTQSTHKHTFPRSPKTKPKLWQDCRTQGVTRNSDLLIKCISFDVNRIQVDGLHMIMAGMKTSQS